jgi:hypothetical protein
MGLPRKVRIAIGTAIIAIVSVPIVAYFGFGFAIESSLRAQAADHDAAKPGFRAKVTSKLKVGDSLQHVEAVLREADMRYSFDRQFHSVPTLILNFHTGPGSGLSLTVEFDANDRIARIQEGEFFLGP